MDSFRHYLTDHLAKFVQLGRAGPEACQGQLLHIGQDYLTLGLFDGARLHFPLHHLRSVTPIPEPVEQECPAPGPDEAWPETCGELLASLIGQPVLLNHAAPDEIFGTLLAATDEIILLEVQPEDRVCLPRFHLKSVCRYEDDLLEPEGTGSGKGSL